MRLVEGLEADVVIRIGRVPVEARRHGAARHDGGTLHHCSAVCTHLKCIVEWNSAEKSWDCPCHGSRYDPYGKVLNGPAISALEPVEQPSSAVPTQEERASE